MDSGPTVVETSDHEDVEKPPEIHSEDWDSSLGPTEHPEKESDRKEVGMSVLRNINTYLVQY